MGDYKKERGFAGKSRNGSFSKGRNNHRDGERADFNRGGRKNSERTEMFRAVCATCNKSCDIPFKPLNDRPVYCSDCFQANREREGGRSEGLRRDSSRHSDSSQRYPKNSSSFTPQRDSLEEKHVKELKKQIEITNDKLEQIIQLLRGEVKGNRNTHEEKTLKSIVNEVIASDRNDVKKTVKKTPKKVAKKISPKNIVKKVIKKKSNKTTKKLKR